MLPRKYIYSIGPSDLYTTLIRGNKLLPRTYIYYQPTADREYFYKGNKLLPRTVILIRPFRPYLIGIEATPLYTYIGRCKFVRLSGREISARRYSPFGATAAKNKLAWASPTRRL